MVHAEGLGGRGGRRGGVVRRIGSRSGQAVAVVGNTQTVCGLAVGSGGKVGADPGRLPPDRPGRQRRPASRVVFVVRVIS